jgi:hypothetical protein
MRPYLKNNWSIKGWGPSVEHLPNKHKAISSTPRHATNNNKTLLESNKNESTTYQNMWDTMNKPILKVVEGNDTNEMDTIKRNTNDQWNRIGSLKRETKLTNP